jgi:hypothetical protein
MKSRRVFFVPFTSVPPYEFPRHHSKSNIHVSLGIANMAVENAAVTI